MRRILISAKHVSRRCPRRRAAFVLMEILVALGILILGLAVIGSQIRQSWRASYEMEDRYTALLLAESFVASLDAGLTVDAELDDEIEGDWIDWDELFEDIDEEFRPPPWGELYPQYGWRLRLEPCGLENMLFVTLEILFDRARRDTERDFDFDEAQVVHTIYLMRAVPARIDLTRDFGLPPDEAESLAEQLADVGESGLDPYDLDPSVLQTLDLEELVQIAPTLLATMGLSMDEILPLLPAELQAAIEEVQGETEPEDSSGEESKQAAEFTAPADGGGGSSTPAGGRSSGLQRQGGAGVGVGGNRMGGRGGSRGGRDGNTNNAERSNR